MDHSYRPWTFPILYTVVRFVPWRVRTLLDYSSINQIIIIIIIIIIIRISIIRIRIIVVRIIIIILLITS